MSTPWSGNIVIELDGYVELGGPRGRDRKKVEAHGKGTVKRGYQRREEKGPVREGDRIELGPGEQIKLKLKDVTGVFYQLWLYRESQGQEDPQKTGTLLKQKIDEAHPEHNIFDGDVHLLAEPNSITITHRSDPEQVEHAHFRFSVFFEIDNIRYVWDPDVHDLGGTG